MESLFFIRMMRCLKISYFIIIFNIFKNSLFCMEKTKSENDCLNEIVRKINENIKIEEAKEEKRSKEFEEKLQKWEGFICNAFGIKEDQKSKRLLFKCKLGVNVDRNQNNRPNGYDIRFIKEDKSFEGYPVYVFEYSNLGEYFDRLDVYFFFISYIYSINSNFINFVDRKEIDNVFENIGVTKILKFKDIKNLYEDRYYIYDVVIEYGEKLKKTPLDLTCGFAYDFLEYYNVNKGK